MDIKKTAFASAVGLVGLALYAAWLWQPGRQVERHTAAFLKAVERRNWDRVAAGIADNYSDRWEHDKDFVLREAREVFRQFFFLSIQSEPGTPAIAGREGTLRSRIRIAGDGSPVAHFVVEKVNALQSPFIFTWQRTDWAPWRWQLTRIDHPELEIPSERGF